jgi:hypothetical protein
MIGTSNSLFHEPWHQEYHNVYHQYKCKKYSLIKRKKTKDFPSFLQSLDFQYFDYISTISTGNLQLFFTKMIRKKSSTKPGTKEKFLKIFLFLWLTSHGITLNHIYLNSA